MPPQQSQQLSLFTPPKRRRIIVDLQADAKKAEGRMAAVHIVGHTGMFPLDAPGMPLPGPDFLEHARALGDSTDFKKRTIEPAVEGGRRKSETVLDVVGDRLNDLYLKALREPGFTMPVTVRPGIRKNVSFVPGHIWGQYMAEYEAGAQVAVDGPRPADVMVIGKMPGKTEAHEGRNLVGDTGEILVNTLRQYHVKGTPKWYVTNLLKFQPPDETGQIKANWLKDCLPLLHQELRIVRPKFILCLGSDASKALLGPKFGVDYMDGRVMEIEYPLHTDKDDPDAVVMHKALVMTVIHPAAVAREPTKMRQLERGIARFDMLQRGIRFDEAEQDIDHRTVRTLSQLKDLIREIEADPGKRDRWIALDAEWHGEHPQNKSSYVRTIQFSWKPKTAACLVWSDTEGKCAFFDDDGRPAQKRAAKLLDEWLARKRIIGHFLVADLEWLTIKLGMRKVVKAFKVPLHDKRYDDFTPGKKRFLKQLGFASGDIVPAFFRTHFEGGHDTGLGGHAIEETAQLGLEVLLMRYTTCPRYDIPLHNWKEAYCKSKGIKAKDLEGYGPCPDDVIIPYGNYDADGTYRLAMEQMPLIDRDYEGNNCRESFWESMLTVGPILEMHQTGIPADKTRIDYLTSVFMKAKDRQEAKIREWARWPEFNIRSVIQVREFLFGEKYNGKKTPDGRPVSVRPHKGDKRAGGGVVEVTAKSLYLDPILDTSKPPKAWADIRERGREHEHMPGTGKTILGVLAQENQDQSEYVQWIRDYRFLDQVLKSVLRPPLRDKQGNIIREADGEEAADPTAAGSGIDPATGQEASPYSFGTDNLGGVLYDAGLASVICDDGRVRTHLYPTTETKRWRSARPNLQNMCFDGATELLTPRGWVRADEFLRTDQVAQYWTDTKEITFVRPSQYIVKPFAGSMCRIKTEDQIDLMLTPNHRCLLRNRKTGKTSVVQASAFRSDQQHLHAGFYEGGSTKLSAAQVTFLCALQADGSYNKNGNVYFKSFIKPRKWQRLERALRQLKADYSKYVKGERVGFYIKAGDPLHNFAKLWMPNKEFGPALLTCDRETLDLFRDEVLLWDGLYTRGTEYSSSDKVNADWVQILWTLSGWRARMRTYRPSNPNARDHYCVNIPERRVDYSLTTNFTKEEIPWGGENVYCVTVPSSFVVVRRNGKVSVTGNSKRRDPDYTRLLGGEQNKKGKWVGGDYRYKLRSLLHALPGHVLIESDFIGAELYLMAVMSGDPVMIDHATRNQLPEDDPNFYDIHSNIAVLAFNLQCLPTKQGLESIGKIALRIAAKNVIFGVAYGRQAKAIALQCKEEGNPISVSTAQKIIDTVFQLYPGLLPFFAEAQKRSKTQRWICSCFGAFRRFPRTDDFSLVGEFERQAMNFPIQSGIASCMDRALAFIEDYRETVLADEDFFKFALQVHDAVMLHVPYANVERVVDEVLPVCMSKRVEIWPSTLDGVPTGKGPFRLGIDTEIFDHWGEPITVDFCREHGIPERFGKKAA